MAVATDLRSKKNQGRTCGTPVPGAANAPKEVATGKAPASTGDRFVPAPPSSSAPAKGAAPRISTVQLARDGAEQAMFQSYREGFDLLASRKDFGFDLSQLAQLWRHGSVIRADLLDRCAKAFTQADPVVDALSEIAREVPSGRAAVKKAIDLGLNTPAIDAAVSAAMFPTPRREGPPPPARPVGMNGPIPDDAITGIGMIGLGRMGGNMITRIKRSSPELQCVGLDPYLSEEARAKLEGQGVETAESRKAMIERLRGPDDKPVTIWLMTALKAVDATYEGLSKELRPGDTVIDGGNCNFNDTQERARMMADKGIQVVDVGTSGGIWGITEGYSMMVGAPNEEIVQKLRPVLEALAPGPKKGWGWVGPQGAGHYAKMVHNAVEYGTMEAIAEGLELVARAAKAEGREVDIAAVAESWRANGPVASWLMDLTSDGLAENPDLAGIGPKVADSGEGRWTILEAMDQGVPMPVVKAAMNRRFASQGSDGLAEKLLAMMRNQFGGHPVEKA